MLTALVIRTLGWMLLVCSALLAQPFVADGAPFAYVARGGTLIALPGEIAVIDLASNTVVATIAPYVIPVTTPSGVAVSPDGARVYVTDSSGVLAILTATNTVTATLTTGLGPEVRGVVATPDGRRIYVAHRQSTGTNGAVSAIDTATFQVIATIPVGAQCTGVATTPDGTRVYATNQGANTVSVIDTATNAVTATVAVANAPFGVAITPDGTRAYVANSGSNSVSVIGTAGNTVMATIAVGRRPFGIAVTPDGRQVYVANNGNGSISVIDTATNAVTATIITGFNPIGLDITADSARVYATINNFVGFGNVSVISTATNTVTGTITVDKPTAFGKFITPPPGPPPDSETLIAMSPPDFPYKVTFEEQCVESIGRLCLRKEIVRVCVGGNCFKPPPPPPPPICVRCALGAGLAAGTALGAIGAMLLARRRRR
jgi:YVTN family beta-propeller protein